MNPIDVDIYGPAPQYHRYLVVRHGEALAGVWGALSADGIPARLRELDPESVLAAADREGWTRWWSRPRDRAMALTCLAAARLSDAEPLTPVIAVVRDHGGDWELWPRDFTNALQRVIDIELDGRGAAELRLRAAMHEVWYEIDRAAW